MSTRVSVSSLVSRSCTNPALSSSITRSQPAKPADRLNPRRRYSTVTAGELDRKTTGYDQAVPAPNCPRRRHRRRHRRRRGLLVAIQHRVPLRCPVGAAQPEAAPHAQPDLAPQAHLDEAAPWAQAAPQAHPDADNSHPDADHAHSDYDVAEPDRDRCCLHN